MSLKKQIPVLDHGYVSYIDHMGGEERIIEAARQSTQKGFLGWGPRVDKHGPDCNSADGRNNPSNCFCSPAPGDEKLLEYLYKNKHFTPFEMVELTIQVKAPIMVFREWHRHRTQSYNEMSGRYIQMPNEHYVPKARVQDQKNKQGSSVEAPDLTIVDNWTNEWDQVITVKNLIENEQRTLYQDYEAMLSAGVAKEVARINTPISRYSVMYAKANLRNWLGFLDLRTRPNAQWEIIQYANAVASIIKELWPRTYTLYEEYTRYSCSLSATEVRMLIDNIFKDENWRDDESLKKLIERLKESQK